MLNFYNSSTIYVSQRIGDDRSYSGLSPVPNEFGDGPFRTIKRAFDSVGEMRVAGFMRPVTIALVDDYFTEGTIDLNCDKSVHGINVNTDMITIESYKDRKKIVGGIRISGWQKDTFNGVSCISAQLPEKRNNEKWDFVDLIVNGRRAENTRYPCEGTLKAVDTEHNYKTIGETPLFDPSKWIIADKKDLENIAGIGDAIISFNHYWVDEHTPIESYDRETGKLVFKYPSRFTVTTIYGPPEEHTSAFRYYLENIPSMFKNANEWYLDRESGKVYYIPEDDIDLESIEAYAPTVQKIFEICGNNENPARDIRLRNLELMCTSSNYYSKNMAKLAQNRDISMYEGFASDAQSACFAHGAVSFENAERCSVTDCVIKHVGTYAVEVKARCKYIRIENNIMDDLGAGGVRIFGERAPGNSPAGGVTQYEVGDTDRDNSTSGCIIRGNRITNCGKKIAAGCGVLMCHASNCEIAENEIAYLEYSGISVGWEWGYFPNASYGNIIRDNHIHHVGQGRLSDMGGIYLLGKQQGTVVSGNRIHDVSSAHYGGWGIYTDEGSSYITIENNVVYNTKTESLHQHYGSYNIVRNNIFAFGSACVRVSKNEMHDCIAFENNIFVVDNTNVYSNSVGMNNIISKNNIIYDISEKEPVMFRNTSGSIVIGFDKWTKEAGKDIGSVVADPKFTDIGKYDFTIFQNSPAIKLGFKPINGFTASGKK